MAPTTAAQQSKNTDIIKYASLYRKDKYTVKVKTITTINVGKTEKIAEENTQGNKHINYNEIRSNNII